jgi:hypothetical protein
MSRPVVRASIGIVFALLFPSAASAYSQRFSATADSYVSAGAPASNYGTATRLWVAGSPTMNSYLQFNVELPTGATVTGATLLLYAGSGSTLTGFQAYAVTNTTWNETGITFANAPPLGAQLGASGEWSTAGYKPVILRASYIHPGLNSIGVATTGLSGKSFYSREAGVNAPSLIVSYTITASQGFVASADSYVSQAAPTSDFGTSTRLWVAGGPTMNSYLRFNVQLPTGATITGATLLLYAGSGSTLTGYQAYAVANTSWSQNTITYANAPPLGALLGSSGGWSAAGYKPVTLPASYIHPGVNSIGIATTGVSSKSFYSSEAGSNQPELAISYTATGTVHYAIGSSENQSIALSMGFNVMDIAGTGSPADTEAVVDALPPGIQALISVVNIDNDNCTTPDYPSAEYQALVDAMANDPKVYGYYIADEPHPLVCPNAASDIRARADYLHAHAPGQQAFIVVQDGSGPCGTNLGCEFSALQPANTHVDLIGLDPYPCHYDSLGNPVPCDYSLINQRVGTALANGIPLGIIVPLFQTFGQEGRTDGATVFYRTPSASELSTILSTWNSVVPDPPMDYAYTVTVQCTTTSCPAPQALENQPELQPAILTHNT